MKKIAIIHGALTSPVLKKAVAVLSELLLDYTYEYPCCFASDEVMDLTDFCRIYIGTRASNDYISRHSTEELTREQEYALTVRDEVVTIEGFDDAGVLYGCMDFYNHYLLMCEYPHNDRYRVNCFEGKLPDFSHRSHPSVRERGLWTWGHVIYDYRRYLDNMVKLKMNTLIVWNDHAPVNAEEMVAYAHACGIKIIWGYAWLWDTNCKKIALDRLEEHCEEIFEKYEREYSHLGGDGIYFQSVTELREESIDGIVIADAVTRFVNKTAALFFEKYPRMELQFGLHATSVKTKLEYIRAVDSRIRIVWEDCGSFPFSYIPTDVSQFAQTMDFVDEIACLRGVSDRFGAVTKGLTKLDWRAFSHPQGPLCSGVSSKEMRENRVIRKRKIWRYLQAYWLTHADFALDAIREMVDAKDGELMLTALVEDGMFEENIMYPVALYSEMLWDAGGEINRMMSEVALRGYVDFA